MNTSGWVCLVLVAAVVVFKAQKTGASDYCDADWKCKQRDEKCCDNSCTKRTYCSGLCFYDSHCDQSKNERCRASQCVVSTATDSPDYCRYSTDCPAKQRCNKNNKCIPRIDYGGGLCHCSSNEDCVDGNCVKKPEDNSFGFSPASIAGLTVVVVIGSCVACMLYCICGRRTRDQSSQPAQNAAVNQNTRQHPSVVYEPGNDPQGNTIDVDVNNIEGSASIVELPLPRDAPPPYHSIDFDQQNEPEQLAPPSYQQALRNSQNNLDMA